MTDECSVCLRVLTTSAHHTTPCNHNFHKTCLRRWVRRQSSCPLCRYTFSQYDVDLINDRSSFDDARRVSRQVSEDAARADFGRAGISFFYMPSSWCVSSALWVVHTINGTTNWMPQRWIEFYETRSQGQTLEAYRLCNQQGAACVLRSRGGTPPRRLHYCRICRGTVYSEHRLLKQHYEERHAEINTSTVNFLDQFI